MFGHHVTTSDPRKPTKAGAPTVAGRLAAAAAWVEDRAGMRMRAAQVFFGSPRSFDARLTPGEAAGLPAYLRRTGTTLLVHGSYLDAALWRAGPAGASPAGRGRAHAARANILRELALAEAAGALGVVLHLPAGAGAAADTDAAAAPAAVAAALADLLGRARAPSAPPDRRSRRALVFLEPPGAGAGAAAADGAPPGAPYARPADIGALFAALAAALPEGDLARVGYCPDTAHLWAAGVDISGEEGAREWIRGLDAVRRERGAFPLALHLNDNKFARGSGRDAHAPVGGGAIWGETRAGARAFAEWAAGRDIPVVFELANKPAEILADYAFVRGAHV